MQSDVPYAPEAAAPFEPDRRHWPRIESTPMEIAIIADGHSWTATVIDESLGGIGIVMDPPLEMDIGDQVQLLIEGNCFPATIKSSRAQNEGAFRIGLEWPTIGRPAPEPPTE